MLDFLAPGWLTRELIPVLRDLHRASRSRTSACFPRWRARTSRASWNSWSFVRRCERCWVKLSGAYRISLEPGFADTVPLARALIVAAPERVIWDRTTRTSRSPSASIRGACSRCSRPGRRSRRSATRYSSRTRGAASASSRFSFTACESRSRRRAARAARARSPCRRVHVHCRCRHPCGCAGAASRCRTLAALRAEVCGPATIGLGAGVTACTTPVPGR